MLPNRPPLLLLLILLASLVGPRVASGEPIRIDDTKVAVPGVDIGSAQPGSCCGPGCRSVGAAETHYDEKYFEWQRTLGEKKANEKDWSSFYAILPHETVLDFGAGTGAILSKFQARRLIAVEFSHPARAYMARHYPSIERHQYPETVEDSSVDLVVSSSVIEHIDCPIQELRALYKLLRWGHANLLCIVPCLPCGVCPSPLD